MARTRTPQELTPELRAELEAKDPADLTDEERELLAAAPPPDAPPQSEPPGPPREADGTFAPHVPDVEPVTFTLGEDAEGQPVNRVEVWLQERDEPLVILREESAEYTAETLAEILALDLAYGVERKEA